MKTTLRQIAKFSPCVPSWGKGLKILELPILLMLLMMMLLMLLLKPNGKLVSKY